LSARFRYLRRGVAGGNSISSKMGVSSAGSRFMTKPYRREEVVSMIVAFLA
jgi:hypothetical protein